VIFVNDPRYVLTGIRRCAAIAAMLVLAMGNLAVCAGWEATPEARMACCKEDGACPMHRSETREGVSRTTVTQAQADSCCAGGAERRHSTPTGAAFVLHCTVVIAAAPTVAVVPVRPLALQSWRALVPLPVSPVPKHLLLSILLV